MHPDHDGAVREVEGGMGAVPHVGNPSQAGDLRRYEGWPRSTRLGPGQRRERRRLNSPDKTAGASVGQATVAPVTAVPIQAPSCEVWVARFNRSSDTYRWPIVQG